MSVRLHRHDTLTLVNAYERKTEDREKERGEGGARSTKISDEDRFFNSSNSNISRQQGDFVRTHPPPHPTPRPSPPAIISCHPLISRCLLTDLIFLIIIIFLFFVLFFALCQDSGNRTTRRPDHRKETQTEVVWTCLPFIKSDQNHLARHSERGKKIRQTEKRGGKTTSRNGQVWSSPRPRGQRRTEKNGGIR